MYRDVLGCSGICREVLGYLGCSGMYLDVLERTGVSVTSVQSMGSTKCRANLDKA